MIAGHERQQVHYFEVAVKKDGTLLVFESSNCGLWCFRDFLDGSAAGNAYCCIGPGTVQVEEL